MHAADMPPGSLFLTGLKLHTSTLQPAQRQNKQIQPQTVLKPHGPMLLLGSGLFFKGDGGGSKSGVGSALVSRKPSKCTKKHE